MNAVLKSACWLLPSMLLMQACGGDSTRTIRFSPQVREQPLSCSTSYPDIGTSRGTIQLLDFKMYLRDITLVRSNGERVAMKLEQDGTWQRDSIALLDFEDGTGTCDTGSPQVRREVVGTVADHDDYTGLEFKVGLPPEMNHLDGATAPAPLNAPGMWWSWQGGYKFLRLDVRTEANESYFFHLGAAGCKGSVGEGFTCASDNQAQVTLSGFNPDKNEVVLDVAGLYSELDVEHVPDGTSDTLAGCMSSAADPECAALFKQVGLSVNGSALERPETFFRVR
ncbi:metallo-mystery pair system four-Cys motif protein [Pyxidicoccus parkwayensis]|uniref:Metallo-mystery pair system four-Cys motif protein n=1 Tax=Pyxidicoccus parkwayensis TaxID=2813578 RepID=A0ABX7NUR6_9BACT|nr:MbnP family copper-binding protein [Pyxidicoccus parkwaysis]QSQ22161.1 metallo-mystery pair system four-Cys motif protein [Pyxidicoccus parkwaysis]